MKNSLAYFRFSSTALTGLFLVFTACMALPVWADYLSNTDLKEGLEGWHGEGDAAFLKPDGTEGAEFDPGAIPVIRLLLSSGSSHSVYQNFETHDKPTTLRVKVEVYASKDFKRSTFASDYGINWKAGGTWYWSEIVIPNVDFWIRTGGSSWCYKLANLKPGNWVTVNGAFEGLNNDEDRVVNFCVPPGHGTIYIKNPSETK